MKMLILFLSACVAWQYTIHTQSNVNRYVISTLVAQDVGIYSVTCIYLYIEQSGYYEDPFTIRFFFNRSKENCLASSPGSIFPASTRVMATSTFIYAFPSIEIIDNILFSDLLVTEFDFTAFRTLRPISILVHKNAEYGWISHGEDWLVFSTFSEQHKTRLVKCDSQWFFNASFSFPDLTGGAWVPVLARIAPGGNFIRLSQTIYDTYQFKQVSMDGDPHYIEHAYFQTKIQFFRHPFTLDINGLISDVDEQLIKVDEQWLSTIRLDPSLPNGTIEVGSAAVELAIIYYPDQYVRLGRGFPTVDNGVINSGALLLFLFSECYLFYAYRNTPVSSAKLVVVEFIIVSLAILSITVNLFVGDYVLSPSETSFLRKYYVFAEDLSKTACYILAVILPFSFSAIAAIAVMAFNIKRSIVIVEYSAMPVNAFNEKIKRILIQLLLMIAITVAIYDQILAYGIFAILFVVGCFFFVFLTSFVVAVVTEWPQWPFLWLVYSALGIESLYFLTFYPFACLPWRSFTFLDRFTACIVISLCILIVSVSLHSKDHRQ